MDAKTRLANLLKSTDGQKAYLAWATNDITRLVLDAAREMARPHAVPTPIDPYAVIVAHGRSVGANEIIDFISSPGNYVSPTGNKPRELVPDYGSHKLLKEMQSHAH